MEVRQSEGVGEDPESTLLRTTNGDRSAIVSDTVAVRLQEPRHFRSLASDTDFRSRPALYIPESVEIPSLAAQHAIDYWCNEGPPDLLISVISDPGSSLKNGVPQMKTADWKDCLREGLLSLAEYCNCWFVSSGLESDPLARIVGRAVRKIAEEREYVENHAEFIRAQRGDNEAKPDTDVKLFALNSVAIVPEMNSASAYGELSSEANGWHTHFVLLERKEISRQNLDAFRCDFFLELAESQEKFQSLTKSSAERYVSFPIKRDQSSNIPLTESLRRSGVTIAGPDKLPAVVLFAGSTLASLVGLAQYIRNNIPAVIFYDSSNLCQSIYTAFWHYTRNPSDFDHYRFVRWFDERLRCIASQTNEYSEQVIEQAKSAMVQILQQSGDKQLIRFLSLEHSEDCLHSVVVEACVKSASSSLKLLPLVVKFNLPKVAFDLDISAYLESKFCTSLFEEALSYPYRNSAVNYFLQSGFCVSQVLEGGNLLNLFKNCQHQEFFQTVILGHLLRYPGFPQDARRFLRVDLNNLLEELASTSKVVPPSVLLGAPGETRVGDVIEMERKSHDVLTYWAILMKRGELAKLLWAYSHDPIPLALVLSQICKSLSWKMHDWHFHEQYFRQLGKDFAEMAVDLLDLSHQETPHRSYDVLCHAFEQYGGLAATHLAYQAGNKGFIAHECCQIWVSRLLYGRLQVTNLTWGFVQVPSWIKVLLSAIFVLPLKLWVKPRSSMSSSKLPRDTSTEIILNNHNLRDSKRTDATASSAERMRMTQSNCSMLSVRSLREETLVMSNEPAMAEEMMSSGGVHAVYAPLATSEGGGDQPDSVLLINSFNKSRYSVPESMSFVQMVGTFYCTPVAKYWLSLIFRLVHLALFGYALSVPGCGRIDLDLTVWLWSFIAWTESIWVVYLKKQELKLRNLRWQVVDVVVVMLFLILMMVFKIVANQPEVHLAQAYVGRSISAFFLLYLCYSTLFVYIPMSETLGPLIVRIKLMVIRDFVNYLVLVILVIASCAVVVHSVLFPDFPASPELWHQAFHWAWFSLFTTDLSGLKEPDQCQKYSVEPSAEGYCSATGGYTNPRCPTPGWVGYIAVIQYFVFLKLICWPLLFALFGKTAKEVDDEADHIWKYQFYGLVTEFSLRPPLPPPLTPFVLLCLCCLRTYGAIRKNLTGGSDHPDAGTIQLGSVLRLGKLRDAHYYSYWRALALQYWKERIRKNEPSDHSRKTSTPHVPLCLLKHHSDTSTSMMQKSSSEQSYGKEEVSRLRVSEDYRSWNVLVPNYYPAHYSMAGEEFPEKYRMFVDGDQEASNFKNKNPFGRTGLAGRGELLRFGPNPVMYCLIKRSGSDEILVKKDEHSHALPKNLCVPGEKMLESLKLCFPVDEHRVVFFIDECFSKLMLEGQTILSGAAYRIAISNSETVDVACAWNDDVDNSLNTDDAWVRALVWVVSVQVSVENAILAENSGLEFVSCSAVASYLDSDDCAVVKMALSL